MVQTELAAPCNILCGDKMVLQYDPVLMKCMLKIPAMQRCRKIKTMNCPVKSCHSCNLKKLSNHLIQVHGITNKSKRRKLLHKAKKVSTKKVITVRHNYIIIIFKEENEKGKATAGL